MENEKLDLLAIFAGMPDYVIMRIPEKFPEYETGTDVDVLCLDLTACVNYLKGKLKVVEVPVEETQIHLDYFTSGKLNIKFDLYGEYISEQFKEDVFANRRHSSIHGVWVPWEVHNLASRYYEYRVKHKEKYSRHELYKYVLDEYITL